MTSLVAHTLGSAIAIESILVFSLGVLLLYFACKCAIVLVHDKRRPAPRDIELSRYKVPVRELKYESPSTASHGAQTQHIHIASSTDLSQSVTHFTGWCSSPLFKSQPSNICQRLFRQLGHGESSKDIHHSSQSSSDHHEGLSSLSHPT
ncbi:hypothetical protein Vadar_006525 [Vaccinium darrowii]|uniref:Uncharacterized protein n=1 Tax=Vaccinium darrowii TaxID=229202 RepID=A0ACB7XP06_9ERIC|nr:hypothetical protein Vadar_006525 [Vaccinium darrowii]